MTETTPPEDVTVDDLIYQLDGWSENLSARIKEGKDHPAIVEGWMSDIETYGAIRDQLHLLKHSIIAAESAAKTFRWYEELHRAKPDHDKADRNRDFAVEQKGIISRAREIGAI